MKALSPFASLLFLIQPQIAPAANIALGGGEIIRISDGTSPRCINATTDQVTLYLVDMVTEIRQGWISKTKSVGLFVETTLEGVSSEAEEKILIPRSFMVDVTDYGSGLVKIPAEQRLLSRFKLSNQDNIYSSIKMEFKLIKDEEDGVLNVALETLSEATKKLPMPANPFVDGVGYFAELSNGLVSKLMSERDNPEKVAPEAQIGFEFSMDGQCSGNLESTGIIAVIKEPPRGVTGDNIVEMAQLDQYCFRYGNSPFKRIEFSREVEGSCDNSGSYQAVGNPHYVYALSATTRVVSNTQVRRNTSLAWLQQFKDPDNLMGVNENLELSEPEMVAGLQSWLDTSPKGISGQDTDVLYSMKGFSNLYSDKKIFQYAGQELPSDPMRDALLINEKYPQLGELELFPEDSQPAIMISNDLGAGGTMTGSWTMTGINAAAQDLVDSLKRCELIGVPAEDCI